MSTLVIDASGAVASVAVLEGARVLASGDVPMRNREREPLLPLVLSLCANAGVAPEALAEIVVGAGPGAFTSLRIAAATAKGLVHGTGIALRAVPSLVLAAASAGDAAVGTRLLMASDALRGDCYAQLVVRGAHGWEAANDVQVVPGTAIDALAEACGASDVHRDVPVRAASLVSVAPSAVLTVSLPSWEPAYGRLAEAQVKWEAAHGRPLAGEVASGPLDADLSAPAPRP
jgi:tRNA threonylcarbamoyladenosine biosynthesis protein TsaB